MRQIYALLLALYLLPDRPAREVTDNNSIQSDSETFVSLERNLRSLPYCKGSYCSHCALARYVVASLNKKGPNTTLQIISVFRQYGGAVAVGARDQVVKGSINPVTELTANVYRDL